MHLFQTGQGKGICGFRTLLLGATTARTLDFNVDIAIEGSSDRLLRSGSWLGKEVLAGAGIRLHAAEGSIGDEPYADGQRRVAEAHQRNAQRLESRLIRFVRRLWDEETAPDLEVGDLRDLPGLAQSLAVGSGLDWMTREEAVELEIDRHMLARFATHRSWRGNAGRGGSWLVPPGFRQRMRLPTVLRPVLLKHYEETIMTMIKLRFPSANLLDPIVIWPCRFDAAISEKNAKELARFRGEQLIAVDHATIHWGSVLDLDLMLRQRSSALRTILCSTYAAPATALNVLLEAAALFDKRQAV